MSCRAAFVASLFGIALGVAAAGYGASAADGAAPEPNSALADIDTRLTDAAVQALQHGGADAKRETLAAIRAAPGRYAPPALYALAQALYEAGEKDEAAFWFYGAQLRASFDANRCADPYARRALDVLNRQYGRDINRHALQDLAKLEALIPRVVAWDRATPHAYDHRWINLHGVNATLAGRRARATAPPLALSLPESQWPEIAARTREEYLAGFRAALAALKAGRR